MIVKTDPRTFRHTAEDVTEIFLDIVGRIGMLEIAAFGSAMLADNDE